MGSRSYAGDKMYVLLPAAEVAFYFRIAKKRRKIHEWFCNENLAAEFLRKSVEDAVNSPWRANSCLYLRIAPLGNVSMALDGYVLDVYN